MDRRDFLVGSLGAVGGVLTPAAMAASKGGPTGKRFKELAPLMGDKVQAALLEVEEKAMACVAAGNSCVAHCQEQLIAGKGTEFQNCTLAAHQMVAVCLATGTLASYRAKLIDEVLEACIEACETCRKACEEHKDHFSHGMHMECKRCMESCIACRDACKKLKAMI